MDEERRVTGVTGGGADMPGRKIGPTKCWHERQVYVYL